MGLFNFNKGMSSKELRVSDGIFYSIKRFRYITVGLINKYSINP